MLNSSAAVSGGGVNFNGDQIKKEPSAGDRPVLLQKSSPIDLQNIPKHWIWNTSLLYATYGGGHYQLPPQFGYGASRLGGESSRRVCEISSDDSEDQEEKNQIKVSFFSKISFILS